MQQQENPNFSDQLNEWQQVRGERGEDPMDWGAFREHLMAIGAPDPGFVPTNEFQEYVNRTGGDKMGAMGGGGITGAMAGAEMPNDTSDEGVPKPDQG